MFPSTAYIDNTTIAYLPAFRKHTYILYWTVLLMIVAALISLPLVSTTISVTAQGITRPIDERTEIKSIIGGIIDTIYYHEGTLVRKGDTLLRIKDPVTKSKRIFNHFETDQHEQFIHDLELLTAGEPGEDLMGRLSSPLYKEQLSRFLHQKADQQATLKKATKELEINSSLVKDKVISPKEFFDIQVQFDKATASYKAFLREQQGNWQQDLARCRLELSQYQEDLNQVNTDASYYEVKAPVSGTLQGINTRYSGGLLQPDETLCTISPDGALIGECYVATKDIGLIKRGQRVRFQVDAFDYNYFGILTGKVISIDNDFTTLNNSVIFKVRCQFDHMQLHLKNGFAGNLQKGLTFRARFILGKRSLWQLLWDNINDWLNPAKANQSTTS
jgi:multidrug resistance efflux pump